MVSVLEDSCVYDCILASSFLKVELKQVKNRADFEGVQDSHPKGPKILLNS